MARGSKDWISTDAKKIKRPWCHRGSNQGLLTDRKTSTEKVENRKNPVKHRNFPCVGKILQENLAKCSTV